MFFICGLSLTLLYVFFILKVYRKVNTLFNPIIMYYALEILRSSFFLMTLQFDSRFYWEYVIRQIDSLEIATFKYFVAQFMFSIILYLTFSYTIGSKKCYISRWNISRTIIIKHQA